MTSKEALDRIDWVLYKLADAIGINFSELVENYNFSDEMEKIISLVERDTPMKVINDTIINGVCLDYKCPSCNQEIDTNRYSKDQYYLIKHCISCGQKLDWRI